MNYLNYIVFFCLIHYGNIRSAQESLLTVSGRSIQGSRDSQQDYFYIGHDNNNPVIALLCDGHGEYGDFIAKTVTEDLKKQLDSIPFTNNKVTNIDAIKQAFTDVNIALKKGFGKDAYTSGCTCIAVLKIDEHFYIAHAGDSRAVWGIETEAQTKDHTGKNSSEVERVGAHNIQGPEKRVGGALAITRAFGDFNLTRKGIIAEPDIIVLAVHETPFIIVGCDGIWDGASSYKTPKSAQTDNNSLIYSLVKQTIINEKNSVDLATADLATARVLAATICSTLLARKVPLFNLAKISSTSAETKTLIKTVYPFDTHNAIEKIDPIKKDLLLLLPSKKINEFIEQNQKYAHDNSTVICIYNKNEYIQDAYLSEYTTNQESILPHSNRSTMQKIWALILKWWRG